MRWTKVEEIARNLATEILRGERSQQLFTDSEYFLAHRYHVNRHTVREAVERLIGAGLLKKRYGEGVWQVHPEHRPLERVVDEILALREPHYAQHLLGDLIGLHRIAVGEIAQLGAERHTAATLGVMQLGLSMLKHALAYKDDALIAREEADLFAAFFQTADSRAWRASLNPFNRLYSRLQVRRPQGSPWVSVSTWDSLVHMLETRKGAVARVLAEEMVRPLHAAVRIAFAKRFTQHALVADPQSPQANPPKR